MIFESYTPRTEDHRRRTILALLIVVIMGAFPGARASAVAPPTDNTLTAAERRRGWTLLFDGKNLDNWMTSSHEPGRKPVEDGCINPHGCGGYMMVPKQQFGDFVLSVDYKISAGCNSGVFVRTSPLEPYPGKDVGWNGIEIQILDNPGAGYTDTGAFYDLAAPKRQAQHAVGEWNHMVVMCRGPMLEVELNGEKVNSINLDAFTEPFKRPDGSAHKFDRAMKSQPRVGYIGLQDHGGDCWFKNIKIRVLKR